MKEFIKLFGREPSRHTESYLEYRGFQDLDKVINQAENILKNTGVKYTIVKIPQLKGFSISF